MIVYHGTGNKSVKSIIENGLRKGSYVCTLLNWALEEGAISHGHFGRKQRPCVIMFNIPLNLMSTKNCLFPECNLERQVIKTIPQKYIKGIIDIEPTGDSYNGSKKKVYYDQLKGDEPCIKKHRRSVKDWLNQKQEVNNLWK